MYILGIGKIIYLKEEVTYIIIRVSFMMGNGKMDVNMEYPYLYFEMEVNKFLYGIKVEDVKLLTILLNQLFNDLME